MIASTAAIAAGHPLGAAAGAEILRDGGNAIDAAVAAMLALSVVIPGSVGLGGYGGSAVIYRAGSTEQGAGSQGTKADGRAPTADSRPSQIVAVDFDSRAPLSFREGQVTVDQASSYYGARAVTVPAVVAGLELILRQFGTKSWREVSQRAIRFAEEGFEFDAEHKRHFDRCAPKFDQQSLESLFSGAAVPEIGDSWRQPELARLLERLVDEGPRSFYEGEIARSIVRYLVKRGGILAEEDLRSYQPQIVEAVHMSCRDFQLYSPPPPSAGILSLGIVRSVERLLSTNSVAPWSAEYFHLLAEAIKLAWQERHSMLGDPDFVRMPTSLDSPHTANVIAIDSAGNVISMTATQGWMYGSHLVVDGLGLVLNHGMSRFDYSPGHPNAPAPGKRMQHNMAPMIVLRNSASPLGRGALPAFAFGMPGGPKIVTVTAQLALNAIVLGATPAESIAAPRLHSDATGPLCVSTHMPTSVVADLQRLGHVVRIEEDMGGPVNALACDWPSRKIDIASGEATGALAGF